MLPQVDSGAHLLPCVGLCHYFEIVSSYNDFKMETQVNALSYLLMVTPSVRQGGSVQVGLFNEVYKQADCSNCCSVG